MNKLLAALLLALCTLTASADVVVEEPKRTSPLIWMAPAGVAIAIAAGVAARRKRRAEP